MAKKKTRAKLAHRKLKRQEEAKLRQAASNKLSVEEKLAKTTSGSWEHYKLTLKLEERKE